jgi:mono/diheme cytochrome c family protein
LNAEIQFAPKSKVRCKLAMDTQQRRANLIRTSFLKHGVTGWAFLLSLTAFLLLTGCGNDMTDQPRHEPFEGSTFFDDGMSARPLVPGTVARGQARLDSHLYTGKREGKFAATFPVPVTRETLGRGKELFTVYCSVCHDRVGNGRGMVVQRGFPAPHSFHEPHMLGGPAGYYFDVITNGKDPMPSYASRIRPRDRWAVVAYIRALQFSQRAVLKDLPPEDRSRLEEIP